MSMAKSARQNPGNKVGRNSGAGPTGVSELAPTEAESRRGLRPLQTGGAGWTRRIGLGLGAAAVLGASVAAFLVQRARKPRGLMDRIRNRLT